MIINSAWDQYKMRERVGGRERGTGRGRERERGVLSEDMHRIQCA